MQILPIAILAGLFTGHLSAAFFLVLLQRDSHLPYFLTATILTPMALFCLLLRYRNEEIIASLLSTVIISYMITYYYGLLSAQ